MITSVVDLAMLICPCERCDLGNYKSWRAGISDLDSLASYVCNKRGPI